MIRKVYTDAVKDALAQKRLIWLVKKAWQYILIHLSFLVKRPLCGPMLGHIVTNYTCNYSCRMCDIALRSDQLRKKGLTVLSTQVFKDVIKDFAGLGTSGISFTGGEPLLRKDIFELIAHAKHLGMVSHLSTNSSLVDEETSKRLVEAGIDSINLSLDGARPRTHDSIRGVKGGFDAVMKAVGAIQSAGREKGRSIRLKFAMTVNEVNIDEVEDLVRLAEAMKIDCVEFIPEQVFYVNDAPGSSRYDEVFFKKLRSAVDFLSKYNNKVVRIENSPRHLALFEQSFKKAPSPLRCFAGYNSLVLDCFGEIYPCVPWMNWGKSAANIKDIRLRDFWFSDKYNKVRQTISKCRDCYLNCQTELNLLFNPRVTESK